jgi:hypothetical protein
MAEELKQDRSLEEQPEPFEAESETWDWARAAGVSREELIKAVELSRPT